MEKGSVGRRLNGCFMNLLTIKAVIAALLLVGGVTAGNYYAMRLGQRERFIEELIGGLRLFRSEIYYTHDRLEQIAKRLQISAPGCSAGLFAHFYKELSSGTKQDSSRIWENAVNRTFHKGMPLKDADRAALLSAGVRLGREDVEGQCGYLDKAAAELETRLAEARRERLERAALYRTLGFAAGAALAILLF